jgi:hypothetical protein
MADDRRPQDKWRHAGGNAPAGGSASAPRGRSRTSQLFLGGLLFAALAGIVAGLIFFLRPAPKPVFLSIAVTEYADRNWPVNAFARQDAEALQKHFGSDGTVAFQSQERELILRELNQLADRSRGDDKGRPIVVHFSANALVHEGAVYVLPGDAKVGLPGTWIKLEDLLDPLKRAQGHRLLILDLRPVNNVRLGSLGNDLGEAVLAALAKAGDLPFQVILSSDGVRSPQVSRELRLSWFGYFMERALAGNADGWNADRKKDGRVSATEVADFVRDYTSFALSTMSSPAQAPSHFGTKDDFAILPVPPSGPTAPPKSEPAEEYPGWLTAGWKERDQWRDAGDHRRLPRIYRHLEVMLLRAEQQWLGSTDLGKAQAEFENEIRELKAIRARFPEPVVPLATLARTEKASQAKRADAESALRLILARIKAGPEPKKEKEEEAELQKLRAALAQKPPDADAAAGVLFAATQGRDELKIDQLKQLLLTAQGLPPLKHIELQMLGFITGIDPKRLQLWDSDAMKPTAQRILLAAQSAEQASAIDGRCLPWVRSELQAADAQRREAIVKLVSGDANDRDAARQQLDACRKRYESIRAAGQALGQTLTELDETRAFLISWVEFEAPDSAIQEELDSLWSSIMGECKELIPLLEPPAEPRLPDAEQLKNRANDLGRKRERVLDLIKIPASASALQVQAWLRSPFWNAERRSQLATRMRETGLSPVEQALRSVPEKPASGARSRSQPTFSKRPLRRALDILSLTGDPDVAKIEKALADAKSDDPLKLQQIAYAIQRGWSERLPERYRQAKDRAEQVRIGWAIHPFDLPTIPRSGDSFPRDAAAVDRRDQEKAFAVWLAENRYRPDARAFSKLAGIGPEQMAGALQELARDLSNWSP